VLEHSPKHEIRLCCIDTLYTSLKIILYNILSALCFECHLSNEVRCGISHLWWCHLGSSEVLELVWWCIPVIPALERLRQEDFEFKPSLGHIGRLT
jgi:hypothetical protein